MSWYVSTSKPDYMCHGVNFQTSLVFLGEMGNAYALVLVPSTQFDYDSLVCMCVLYEMRILVNLRSTSTLSPLFFHCPMCIMLKLRSYHVNSHENMVINVDTSPSNVFC